MKRRGIIAALATIGAHLMQAQEPKATTPTIWEPSTTGKLGVAILSKPMLSLSLDEMNEKAINVHYKGETISLTAEEIMTALRDPK